ncbi:hypothetical protein ACUXST_001000 [Sphingomonas sp. F9_3S_D5_B_2]
MSELPSQLLMDGETKVSYGTVPHSLFGDALDEMRWHMQEDRFLLRTPGEHYFLYRKGHGITVERGEGSDVSEESLWLNGSVYSAIASMNGLLPIHASAVACGGVVTAFTGPAGAGKSTLVAALAAHDLPMFCDDTLVLDLSDPNRIMCLPGHKRLKLRADALQLTGASPQEKVSETVDKFYALPNAGDVGVPLPLGELIFLEEAPTAELTAIVGAERFVRIQDDHQTAHLFAGARQFDRTEQFAHLARLARQIRMARFARPRDATRFAAGVALAAEHVTKAATDSEVR